MPEQPFPKHRSPRPAASIAQAIAPAGPRFAELNCWTNYSFLRAASFPDELVERAVQLGYTALAITDRNSLAGVVRAHAAAKPLGFKLLIGAEVLPSDGPRIVLLAMNRNGYGRLARLLTVGKRRTTKGECQLTLADICEYSNDLLACIVLERALAKQVPALEQFKGTFGDRCYLLAQLHLEGDDQVCLHRFRGISEQVGIPLVASNGAIYHDRSRQKLHDVMTAIRLQSTVEEVGAHRFQNAERYLKSSAEMLALFGDPELIERSAAIADRCSFSLDELRYDYPEELSPEGYTPYSWLEKLAWDGSHHRYPQGLPQKIRKLIEHELELIAEQNYEAYFLTVWDLVRFARERDILCQGRGSAANSAVCFCLGITSVDPDRIDVLFERFISRERGEAPDIDVDFEHERREEVLQYVYNKYGRERAGMTAEVITYRPKSAVRDVGKALGLSLDRVDSLAKAVEHSGMEKEALAHRFREVGFNVDSRLGKHLVELVHEILGFPRHLSQHVGGMVITHRPLCELVAIENAVMADRTVIEWDKNDLDELGILKVDCLALGMLTAIRKAFDLIRGSTGEDWTLATVPAEDPAVYDMLCRAESIGVFQVESRAQMSMLPRLKPRKFYDLVIEVSLVRPGPIQGNMVHPYLRRRGGEEEVTYPSEAVREVLQKTLGVPLFQEQAMRLAVVAAGFSPGEADQLRRAMGAWRKKGVIEAFRQRLVAGMLARGYKEEFAHNVYGQIQGFGEYGFPESHAASFALLVYVSAWLKYYYPAAFHAALVNSQPMGFYAPSQLVSEARRQGVVVRPVCANASRWDCTLEREEGSVSLRLGWRILRGIKRLTASVISAAREAGPFSSQSEFAARTGLGRTELPLLAKADVFHVMETSRRKAHWDALPAGKPGPLYEGLVEESVPVKLTELTAAQETTADYQSTGLSLRAHPLSFIRSDLNQCRVVTTSSLADCENDRKYRVAGLVLLRQRPSTAKGITFMTIEDETGTANLVVHVNVWERFRTVARRATAIIAHGVLQRKDGIVHLVVDRIEDLTVLLGEVQNKSRDFQ